MFWFGLKHVVYAGQIRPDIQNWNHIVLGKSGGMNFRGVVEAVGENVTDVQVGDHVAGCPALIDEDDYYYKAGHPARADSLQAIGALEPGGLQSISHCLPKM